MLSERCNRSQDSMPTVPSPCRVCWQQATPTSSNFTTRCPDGASSRVGPPSARSAAHCARSRDCVASAAAMPLVDGAMSDSTVSKPGAPLQLKVSCCHEHGMISRNAGQHAHGQLAKCSATSRWHAVLSLREQGPQRHRRHSPYVGVQQAHAGVVNVPLWQLAVLDVEAHNLTAPLRWPNGLTCRLQPGARAAAQVQHAAACISYSQLQ